MHGNTAEAGAPQVGVRDPVDKVLEPDHVADNVARLPERHRVRRVFERAAELAAAPKHRLVENEVDQGLERLAGKRDCGGGGGGGGGSSKVADPGLAQKGACTP